ncbi:RNA polymerase sigma factor [Desulfoscipio gibsoniae]|uniref:Response regulator containing a CheY-like receiver domain and an HTH DNA-binding domain n=1 Tax=Desulfoscipio gibsoniae DSM 7213 TaxID=767817 RepID=R4KKM1_9FIRM|nr:sigma factor-like helix-turn-helix DNA-binding protein [Desulfoscipio gibsoniae]AGL03763.1 response regulator containing a CheY-like receiver domain and an HTH DNA-binding domain [Desulfoscipio gibsoniae DSM 7213]
MPKGDNQKSNKEYYLTIDGKKITVTEGVYRTDRRPVWAELKRQEREKRCLISDGKGKTKRCMEDCSQCDKQRIGSVLSLEKFSEDGYEIPGSFDVAELVAEKLLFEELAAALDELDPQNKRIAELYGDGMSERQIADKVGLSQRTVNKRKAKIFGQLHQRLKNYR